ncbi:unnamed protein product [Sphagnum troendelagicum]
MMEKPFKHLPKRHPPRCVLGTFLAIHLRDQVQLGVHVDRKSMCNLVKQAIHHRLRDLLNDNIYLMRSTPHMHDIIGRLLFKQCHQATMATGHGVFAVAAHRD